MAKVVHSMTLAALCIFLVLMSQVEAQQCPSLQITKFAACRGNVQTGSCPANSPCYNALKAYQNLDTRCICQQVNSVVNLGLASKANILRLINNCRFKNYALNC
ncbi:hypothetical protein R1flu_006561 [Riccia fluitans]|uniref:Bifunctional inhibitor/plant lipid transfer protein/seed storage helical domain-containing protein n=1 Tax=Riccia fluitans TaxID=41844 RepID=A0ABD1YZD4_9MARC